MSSLVLDASPLLAVIPGLHDACLSCVNLAEVATRALERSIPLDETTRQIARLPLHIAAFDAEQAYVTASLRPATRLLGLSLGERACLALAMTRKSAVLTGDRDWRTLEVGIEVIVFW